MPIITDSSFIYALYNGRERLHRRATDFARQHDGIMVLPDVILPEVSYLFMRDLGYAGVQRFLGDLRRVPTRPEPLEKADLDRVHEIAMQYGDAQFDVVDCCIMALSERLNITQIATFDRRDFSIFRPRHCAYLELLP